MPKLTKKEIEDMFEELKQAMLAVLSADDEVEKAQLNKQKAHMRLKLARDAVHSLRVI